MDMSKRTLNNDNVQDFADDLRAVFPPGSNVSMETSIEGIGSHTENLQVKRIDVHTNELVILLDGDFIILKLANDPEVEWIDDHTVFIIKGEQHITMSLL